jgi:hypothetical protein
MIPEVVFGVAGIAIGSLIVTLFRWFFERRAFLMAEMKDIADNGRLRQGDHYAAVLKKGKWVWIGWGPGW